MITTNAANFSTFGPLIRLRTSTLPQVSINGATVSGQGLHYPETDENEPASIRALPSHFDATHLSTLHQVVRESNGSLPSSRRTISSRHNSPPNPSVENQSELAFRIENVDEMEVEGNMKDLTERLEFSRREQQEVEKQSLDEEQDSKRVMTDLIMERDALRQMLKEKEDASSELRRHGNYLDKLNRTAQSKKAAKEKLLHQKVAERKRMKDEIERWDGEIAEMGRETDEVASARAEITAAKNHEVAQVRQAISEDHVLIKSLEEEIRIQGIQIKEIEKQKQMLGSIPYDEQVQKRAVKENQNVWEAKTKATQAQIEALWQTLKQVCFFFSWNYTTMADETQARAENQRAQEHLAWWASKRLRDPAQFASSPALDFVSSSKSTRPRQTRQISSRTSTISTSSAIYSASSLVFNNVSTMSPNFSLASPFFNISNGMTVPPTLDPTSRQQAEYESSTDGGAMSPAANDLLPSNLFRDEDLASKRSATGVGHEPVGSIGSEISAGQGTLPAEFATHMPQSPIFARSRTGSLFSSPHDSLHNLRGYQSHAPSFAETDQHSSNSANPLATSRIANLFTTTFNRQRGKSSTNEPPSLGSLKQGQSQSFPRNPNAGTFDPPGSRRRRGSYGNWANPVAGLLNRGTTEPNSSPEDNGLISVRTGSGRRSRLNMFGSKLDGIGSTGLADKGPSSRPSSTYPYDTGLGAISSDCQRYGWPIPEGIPNRNSPLGCGWSTTGGPWSRGQSRRTSMQHGSTSNLSIGSTPLDAESYLGSLDKQVPDQLPIGTRPRSSHQSVTPRLNPAAPTFKTLFGRGDAKRSTKADKMTAKSLEKLKNKDFEKTDGEETDLQYEESSPPDPRLSRDAQSITTATSVADSRESLDRSTSGTPSEALPPSGPKETLMQKITRKSSSSKFNVPWVKDRGSLFSNKRVGGEPLTPDEIVADASSDSQLRRSVENLGSTQQQDKGNRTTLSWQNMRRKSKRNGSRAADSSEKSGEMWDDNET